MSPYTKRRYWMPKRPQVSSRWCSCCIRRSSFAIIKRLEGVVVLMVVGGELQIQSLPTDRLSPWQTYVLVGCINETLLLSWLHNRVNFTSVIWCMCHSIMIIMYIIVSVLFFCTLYLFDFILVLGECQIHFCLLRFLKKMSWFFTCSFQMKQTPSTWHDSNAHRGILISGDAQQCRWTEWRCRLKLKWCFVFWKKTHGLKIDRIWAETRCVWACFNHKMVFYDLNLLVSCFPHIFEQLCHCGQFSWYVVCFIDW